MTSDIVKNIDQRLGQLQGEISKLESARRTLLDGAQPAPAPKPRRARRKTTQPSPQVVPAGKLMTLLGRSEGMTTRELATATNGDAIQLLALLKEQEEAGQLRRSGTRRATRWHLITDEDRLAARAAEIAAQSKRSRRVRKS
jgi:hypothetical protein